MITKLKLQVDLLNKMDVDKSGMLVEEYTLLITFLDKDERFESSQKEMNSLSHNGTGTFVIKTLWDEHFGGILHNGILLPDLEKMGIQHKKTFTDDIERYEFLKKLYTAIGEWANYWKGFKYDESSRINVKDNIWEVVCDCVYNGSVPITEEND